MGERLKDLNEGAERLMDDIGKMNALIAEMIKKCKEQHIHPLSMYIAFYNNTLSFKQALKYTKMSEGQIEIARTIAREYHASAQEVMNERNPEMRMDPEFVP